ncbi:MAG TPA: HAD-IIA family hydrolase [Actinomycetota bacterium]|nr:HAD-IIA family hydrolase [Actinomycetota bacterium]
MKEPHLPPLNAAAHLLEKYDAFAIDLDGVVWRGEVLLPGAVEGLAAIRATGKPLLLLTNNGGYHPDEVVERLGEGGFTLAAEEVLTSSIVAREWIVEQGLQGSPSFILAPQTVAAQLADIVRVRYLEAGQTAELVLVGRDTDFSYLRLALAADAVRAGAAFLSLNKDPVMPIENGGMLPGTGSIVAALETASGRTATVLGKPQAPMMEAAARRLGGGRVLMIGDRLESDIAGARSIGWDGALVLTGLTVGGAAMDPRPDHILTSLRALAVEAMLPGEEALPV